MMYSQLNMYINLKLKQSNATALISWPDENDIVQVLFKLCSLTIIIYMKGGLLY